jgi:hypothetical protein
MTARVLVARILLCCLLALSASVARAQGPAPSRGSWAWDAAATATAFTATILFSLVPVDLTRTWSSELLPFDDAVRNNFSTEASTTSDALVVAAVAAPLVTELGFGTHRELGRTTLLYGQTLGAAALWCSARDPTSTTRTRG